MRCKNCDIKIIEIETSNMIQIIASFLPIVFIGIFWGKQLFIKYLSNFLDNNLDNILLVFLILLGIPIISFSIIYNILGVFWKKYNLPKEITGMNYFKQSDVLTFASDMKKGGMKVDKIIKYTDLTKEQIEQL